MDSEFVHDDGHKNTRGTCTFSSINSRFSAQKFSRAPDCFHYSSLVIPSIFHITKYKPSTLNTNEEDPHCKLYPTCIPEEFPLAVKLVSSTKESGLAPGTSSSTNLKRLLRYIVNRIGEIGEK
jgi:hypothetical protein